MFNKEVINMTEKRAVWHVGLRKPKGEVPEVDSVNERIRAFTDQIRDGTNEEFKGATGLPLRNTLAIGIGGSSLGPLAAHEVLRSEPGALSKA
jgi:glucose-6-phosphate isomerase